jgi:hypothetical protein
MSPHAPITPLECFREKCVRFSRQEARQDKGLWSLRESTKTGTILAALYPSCAVNDLKGVMKVASISRPPYPPTNCSHSSSDNTVTPSSVALSSFEPASAPATT